MSQDNGKDNNKNNLEEDKKVEPLLEKKENEIIDVNNNLNDDNDVHSKTFYYDEEHIKSKRKKKFKEIHEKQSLETENDEENKNLNETSFIDKFKEYFIEQPKKRKKNPKKRAKSKSFLNQFLGDNEDDDNEENKEKNKLDNNDDIVSESSITEENELINPKEILFRKKISIIKEMIEKKENNEWNKYLEDFDEKIKENASFKNKMKNVFNINSDFVVIWKATFSVFNVAIVFIFFFKYIFTELIKKKKDDEEEKSIRIETVYRLLNLMFLFECIISILIIIFNGGSKMSYIKLPLKAFNVIPFPLKKENILFLIPKFFRIDLFNKLFSSIETVINANITHYFTNYYLKIFINYTNEMFKYLVIYGLYAHCLSCLLSCFDYLKYISGLYYIIQTFTTIGFGEKKFPTIPILFIMIIALFVGIAFFAVVTSNIRYLAQKMRTFNRETSFNEQFEILIFKLQKSTGKVFPSLLKQLMAFYLLFKRGLSFSEIYNENKLIIDNCRNKTVKEIQKNMYEFFKQNLESYFINCEEEFVFELFKYLRPKIFNANKTLINYNDDVNGLYVLINGQVFSYNKNNIPIYTIVDTGMFCEYEFITNQRSNEIIKVHPRVSAYGFIIKKQDWEKISKKHIFSSKKFIEQIMDKKRKHLQWLMSSLRTKNLINNDIITNNIYENVDNKNENNVIDQKEKEKEKKNLRASSKYLITLANKKDIKYNLKKSSMILEIKQFSEELSLLENSFIRYKKTISSRI